MLSSPERGAVLPHGALLIGAVQMKIREMIKNNGLMISGLLLPYIAIVLLALSVMCFPYGTLEHKWEKAGWLAFLTPLSASVIGVILIVIQGIKKNRVTASRKQLVHGFLFDLVWASVFHFFITYVHFYAAGLSICWRKTVGTNKKYLTNACSESAPSASR